MMKRFIAFGLALSLLTTVCLPTYAATFLSSFSQDVSVSGTGIAMSTGDFTTYYSGEPSERPSLEDALMTSTISEDADGNTSTISDPTIKISNITVQDSTLSCTVVLSDNDVSRELNISGELGAGFKFQHGVNSVIVSVPDTVDGVRVRLFEIYNDSDQEDTLLTEVVDSSVSASQPHIKLYLQDESDALYLFETELPDTLSTLYAGDYDYADKAYDALWAVDIVQHNFQEGPITDEMLNELGLSNAAPTALNSYSTWIPENRYSE